LVWAVVCPNAPLPFIHVPVQSTGRQNLLHILADDAAHNTQLLGQLALQPTLVNVAGVTQASDNRQPPQPGTQLPDGIVLGAAATPGNHFHPRSWTSPFVFRHL
jgi:hypothetical protein